MTEKAFERETLIKLHAQFSESEAIQLLSKKLKKTQTELGMVISERDEALYLLKIKDTEINALKIFRDNYKLIKTQKLNLKHQNNLLEKENQHLIQKAYE